MAIRLSNTELAQLLKNKGVKDTVDTPKRPKTPKMGTTEYLQLPFEKKVSRKARDFVSHLGWGKGGTDRMTHMVMDALNTPCPYCGDLLSLQTISLDHKVPLLRSKRFDRYRKLTDEYAQLNAEQNLHMICEKCNKRKREIPHDKYLKLLAFLNQDPELKNQVLKRLSSSGMAYMYSRFKRKS